VGYKTGFRKIARLARDMGIRSRVSTNPAITLGGLDEGVTVLDMAHAYETFARRGKRIEGTLGAPDGGPVGINFIREADADEDEYVARNKVLEKEVLPGSLADTVTPILQSVVSSGTGVEAQYGGFAAGKTGTTENYGDAWFVGYTEEYSVAVWVGYPDSVKPMKTDFAGAPVAGGTYPAMIWSTFARSAQEILDRREAERLAEEGGDPETSTLPVDPSVAPVTPTDPTTSTAPATSTPETSAPESATPQEDAPAPDPTPAPAPAPTPATPAPTAPGNTGGVSPSGGGTAAPPAGGAEP
jgi:penicillin-binding protein 1A